MTTTFPPKPWQEGATFTNDTTGVGYTYTGGKWLASGGPKVEGEYLPLSGGKLTGQLTIQADGDAFSIQKKDGGGLLTTFTGSYSSDIQYWKQAKDYSNSKLEIVNGFKLEEYVAEEIGKLPEPSPTTSPFRKFKYAGDRVWANMRPGEFQMLDKDQNITSELDKCQAIIFKGEDADGNRAVRDENAISYSSWGGSALNILNSGQTRLYFRAPIGMLEYGVDIDCYSLWWQELDAGATRTSTFTKFTNSQVVYLQCADLFF